MDEKRLTRILAAYGGDPRRWPDDERQAALSLLDRSPALRALQQQELALDGTLDSWVLPAPSSALVGAVLEARKPVRPAGPRALIGRAVALLARPLMAMAVAGAVAIAGIMTGYALPQGDTAASSSDLLASEVSELILPSTEWASLQ